MESADSQHLQRALYLSAMGSPNAALATLAHVVSPTATSLRGQLLLSLGRPQQAVDVLEQADDVYGRLLLAKALFSNQENERALIELQKLKELLPTVSDEIELQDLTRSTELLARKVQLELTNSSRLGNINDAAYLSSAKPKVELKPEPTPPKSAPAAIDKKYDWYQNATHIFVSYKVSSPEVSRDAKVAFSEN